MYRRHARIPLRVRRSASLDIRYLLPGIVGGLVLLAVGLYAAWGNIRPSGVSSAASCNIKGNVSINSGERIFHVPGQEDYDATKILPQYGERWFCSESEARAAGWRKARN